VTTATYPARRGSGLGLVVRVLIVTGAIAALGFAFAALLGIIVIAAMDAAGARQNMQTALWAYAIPGGAAGAVVGFAVIVWSERKTRAEASSWS
jgi:ABC-type cobalamin transport system permease subunit